MPPPFDQFNQAIASVPAAAILDDPSLLLEEAITQANRELVGPYRALAEAYLSAQTELLLGMHTTRAAVHPCRSLALERAPTRPGVASNPGVYDMATDSLTLKINCPGIDITQTATHEINHGLVRAYDLNTEAAVLAIMVPGLTSLPGNPANVSRISEIAETVLPGPFENSMIRGHFHSQVRDGLVDRLTSYELVGYVSEGLLRDIKCTGNVDGFITRYTNIKQMPSPNRRGEDEHREYLNRAEELVAVTLCEINDHMIDRLEVRQKAQTDANPAAPVHDRNLANMLRKVNRELMPAYQRAYDKLHALEHPINTTLCANIRQRRVIEEDLPRELQFSKDDIGIKDGGVAHRDNGADALRNSLRRHSFSGDPRYAKSSNGGRNNVIIQHI